jgi:hypothetical protein
MTRKIAPKIPRARSILKDMVLSYKLQPEVRRLINRAIKLMYRAPYKRRAKSKRQRIDKHMRKRIRLMSYTYPDMTEHEIANEVGLRSSGRISEVLHGKR